MVDAGAAPAGITRSQMSPDLPAGPYVPPQLTIVIPTLNERDNVAVAVVAAGYAKVRPAGGQQSAFYEDLARAQEQAEAKALGLWTKVCLRWVAGLGIPERAARAETHAVCAWPMMLHLCC